MEREEELEQTIDELNYRLTNALKKIDKLKSNMKQAREEIWKNTYEFSGTGDEILKAYHAGFKDSLKIIDKLIESEEK